MVGRQEMMVDRRKGSVRALLFSLFTVAHFLLREPCCVLSMPPSRKVLPVTHSAGILCKGCLGLYLWVICLLSGNVLLYILTCLKITREVGFCSGRSTGKTISVLFFPHKNIKYFFSWGVELSINFFFRMPSLLFLYGKERSRVCLVKYFTEVALNPGLPSCLIFLPVN